MRLSEFIHSANITAGTLAGVADVDPHVIHSIIGGHVPKVSTAVRISDATGGLVSPQEILGLELCRCQVLDLRLKALLTLWRAAPPSAVEVTP